MPSIRDVAALKRTLIGSARLSQTEPCPDVGSTKQLKNPPLGAIVVGDLMCDGSIDVIDALHLNRVSNSLPPLPLSDDCPQIGDEVTYVVAAEASPTPVLTQPPFIPEGRLVIVYVFLEGSTDVAGLDALIQHDRATSEMVRWECSQSGMDCLADLGGNLRMVAVSDMGLTDGYLFKFEIFVSVDTPINVEALTLVDIDAQPLVATFRTEPTVARMYVRGDSDCDGILTSYNDVMPFLYRLAGLDDLDCAVRAQPGSNISHPQDIDCDGATTTNDLLLILLHFADLPVAVLGCDPVGT